MPESAPPPTAFSREFNFVGRVTDRRTGSGIPRAKVIVYRDGNPQTGGRTKARGYYFLRVPPGTYELLIEADPRDSSSAVRTTLTVADDSPLHRDFVLDGRLALRGSVVDEQGRPLPGVPLHLVKGNWTIIEVRTDAQGGFAFEHLSALPDYELLALPPGCPPAREVVALTADMAPVTLRCSTVPAGAPPLHRLGAALRELWRYRGLVAQMVKRNLRVRYQGSVIGLLWTLADPLLRMVVLTVVFKYLFPARGDIPNFSVFLLVGLVAWQFLTSAVVTACQCLTAESGAATNTAVPLTVFPAAVTLENLVHFVISLVIVFAWLTLVPLVHTLALHAPFVLSYVRPELLWLPVVILLQTVLLAGLAFFFAWVNTLYRDVAHIVNVVLQMGFFASPIIYPATVAVTKLDALRPGLGTLYMLNPMAILIEAYRAVIFGEDPRVGLFPPLWQVAYLVVPSVLLLFIGFWTLTRRQSLLREVL